MSQAQQEAILRGKQETLGEFIWNSGRGEFLGRTGTSWVKIFTFYCIYYAFLAAFFAICMTLFYQTLRDDGMPQYSPGEKNSILKNPSMGYRPRPAASNIESSMITYESGKPDTYKDWTSSIEAILSGKEDPNRNYMKSKDLENGVACDSSTEKLKDGKVCKFDIGTLGSDCKASNDFGYSSDSPCILLKLNRMIGWEPEVYKTMAEIEAVEGFPKQLKQHIKEETAKNNGSVPEMLWVHCEGENPMDSEMLGPNTKYLPTQGFPSYFFPYNNQDNYLSPLISVQFIKPRPHIMINILCQIWGKGITYDKKGGLGMVHFELLRD